MADQQFCLHWNRHQPTLISVLDTLLKNEVLVDCTLAAEGQYLRAHRVVLSACSPYFENLFNQHYARHPILILKDIKLSELKHLMEYMYRGEVTIPQDQMGPFLNAAESLQIKGIYENENSSMDADYTTTPTPEPVNSPIPVVPPKSRAHGTSDSPSRKRKKVNGYNPNDESTNLETFNPCHIPNQSHSISLDTKSSAAVSTLTNSSSTANNLQVGTCNPCHIPNQSHSISLNTKSSAAVSALSNSPSTENNFSMKTEQVKIQKKMNKFNLISSPFGSSLTIEVIEPLSGPKNECLDDIETDGSVEDLTLDDDDEVCESNISCSSNNLPGTSANREFEPSLETVSIHSETGSEGFNEQEDVRAQTSSQSLSADDNNFNCSSCGKSYQRKSTLVRHQRYKCGPKRTFSCSFCAYTTKYNGTLQKHILNKHNDKNK